MSDRLGVEDFRQVALDLLPVGWAWSRDPLSVSFKFWDAVAAELARLHGDAVDLLEQESFPPASRDLLPDWERVAGLPDECADAAQTLEERRRRIAQQLAARGGQSIAYFKAIAAALGYAITVEEFRPFLCGRSRCGVDALEGPADVRHVWRIGIAETRVTWFRAGAGRAGHDRLGRIVPIRDLECLLRRFKPAHTTLVFNYQGIDP